MSDYKVNVDIQLNDDAANADFNKLIQSINNGFQTVQNNLSKMQTGIDALIKKAKNSSGSNAFSGINKEIDELKSKYNEAKAALEKLESQMREAGNADNTLAGSKEDLAAMVEGVKQITTSLTGLENRLMGIEDAIDHMGTRFKSVGEDLQEVFNNTQFKVDLSGLQEMLDFVQKIEDKFASLEKGINYQLARPVSIINSELDKLGDDRKPLVKPERQKKFIKDRTTAENSLMAKTRLKFLYEDISTYNSLRKKGKEKEYRPYSPEQSLQSDTQLRTTVENMIKYIKNGGDIKKLRGQDDKGHLVSYEEVYKLFNKKGYIKSINAINSESDSLAYNQKRIREIDEEIKSLNKEVDIANKKKKAQKALIRSARSKKDELEEEPQPVSDVSKEVSKINTADESADLSSVLDKLNEVTDSVGRKTDAFREEGDVVSAVTQEEIAQIDALNSKVVEVTGNLDKLTGKGPVADMLDVADAGKMKDKLDEAVKDGDVKAEVEVVPKVSQENFEKAKQDWQGKFYSKYKELTGGNPDDIRKDTLHFLRNWDLSDASVSKALDDTLNKMTDSNELIKILNSFMEANGDSQSVMKEELLQRLNKVPDSLLKTKIPLAEDFSQISDFAEVINRYETSLGSGNWQNKIPVPELFTWIEENGTEAEKNLLNISDGYEAFQHRLNKLSASSKYSFHSVYDLEEYPDRFYAGQDEISGFLEDKEKEKTFFEKVSKEQKLLETDLMKKFNIQPDSDGFLTASLSQLTQLKSTYDEAYGYISKITRKVDDYYEDLHRVSGEQPLADVQKEIESEKLLSKSDVTPSVNTADERTDLSALANQVDAVTSAVDRKTRAFQEEGQTVDGVVQHEVSQLQVLDGQVLEVVEALEKLSQNPTDLNLKIDEGLDNAGEGLAKLVEKLSGANFDGLKEFTDALEPLQNLGKVPGNLDKICNSIIRLQESLNNSTGADNSFLANLKEILSQGEELKNLVVALQASQEQLDKVTKGAKKEEIEAEPPKFEGETVAKMKELTASLKGKTIEELGEFNKVLEVKPDGSAAIQFIQDLGEEAAVTTIKIENVDEALDKINRDEFKKGDYTTKSSVSRVKPKVKEEPKVEDVEVPNFEGRTVEAMEQLTNSLKGKAVEALGEFNKVLEIKPDGTAAIQFVKDLGEQTVVTTVKVENLQNAIDAINKSAGDSNVVDIGEYATKSSVIKDKPKVKEEPFFTKQDEKAVKDYYKNATKAVSSGNFNVDAIVSGYRRIKESINESTEAQEKFNQVSQQANAKAVTELVAKQNAEYAKIAAKGTEGKTAGYADKLEELKAAVTDLSNMKIDFASGDSLQQLNEILNKIETIKTQMKSSEFTAVDPKKLAAFRNQFEKWGNVNSKALLDPKIKGEFEEIRKQLALIKDEASALDLSNLEAQFNHLAASAEKSGKTGSSFFDTWKAKIKSLGAYLMSFTSFYDLLNIFREGLDMVRELDTAFVEMQKVSNDSTTSLVQYSKDSFNIAKDVGTTGQQMQQSAADWMRLGESLEDAKESAATSNILLNVSEFGSIDAATESLVSVSQAYQDLEKIDIVDKLNNIGNNFSISTDGLASALQRSASALSVAGNDIDEANALIVAGNQVTQNPESVGAGMRTIALRIMGTESAKEELEDAGEDVSDYVVTTVSKMQEQIKDFTRVASNDFQGVDILDANGNYRSTYEIMQDIADIYEEIKETDKQRGTNSAQALIELLAQRRLVCTEMCIKNPSKTSTT